DDLVVAAAAGVQLPPEVTQPVDEGTFDVGVNVFQLDGKGKLAAVDAVGNFVEGGRDAVGFFRGEQADSGEQAGVGLAGAAGVPVKAAVEADRLGEGFDALVGAAAEAAAPGFLAHDRSLMADGSV